MSTDLSPRQKEVLKLIIHEIQTRGFPPTIREIGDSLKLRSLRGVTIHLDALVKKGFIERSSKARGIRVLKKPVEESKGEFLRIPLLGEIHAGTPLLAEENIEKYVNIKREYLKGATQAFLLKVQGDSMIEAEVYEGDLAIVSSSATAENGDMVVALLEDEVTLKKFHKVGDYIALLPANPSYQPIIGKEFSIQGKVIGIIRKWEKPVGSLLRDSALIPVYRAKKPF